MICHSRRLRRARAGFTLIEVIFAFLILGFGLLSLAAMQLHAMQFGRSGRHQTQAAVIAQDRMEFWLREPWANSAPTGGWTVAVPIDNMVQAPTNQTEMTYLGRERISDLVAGRTRTIDVQIQWSEPDRPNRTYTLSTVRANGGS